MRILYIGYLGFQNVGDEVCFEAFEQTVRKWSAQEHEVVALPLGETVAQFHARKPIDVVVIGGGSLLQGAIFLSLAEEAFSLGFPLFFYGTGIDYLPKKTAKAYLKGENVLPKQYFADRVVPEARIKAVLEKATYVGVRGPLTLQFIKSLGVSNEKIDIIGDSGFIFTAELDGLSRMLDTVNVVTPFVAVNWGTIYNKCFGFSEEAVEQQLIDSIYWLDQKGYQVVIYPMWTEDLPICAALYEKVKNLKSVTYIPKVYTASEISDFLSEAAFSINYKLHGNILSAGSGTPYIKLAYRSKGIDFSSSIDWMQHTFTTDTPSILKSIQLSEKAFKTDEAWKEKLILQKEKYTLKHQKFVVELESVENKTRK